jgi:hypothetical protein
MRKQLITIPFEQIIAEMTAKDLSYNRGSDSDNVGNKSNWVRSSVGIVGYAPTYSIVSFRIHSVSRPNLAHRTYVQFLDLEKLKKQIGELGDRGGIFEDPVKAREIILSIIQSDIKVHCTCESWKYFRSYQMTQLDAAIFPETRPPVRNDPSLSRTHMCHHLFATIKYLFTYEQHLVKFLMMNDKAIANSLKIDANTAAEEQLQDIIDTWTEKIGDSADDEKLGDVLKSRIVNVLQKAGRFINKFRTNEIINLNDKVPFLNENISVEKLVTATDNFITYLTNNFIPKDIRDEVSDELEDVITNTFTEYAQSQEQTELPDEDIDSEIKDIEDTQQGDEKMINNEAFKSIDIQKVIHEIVKNRRTLWEADTPLGPNERPEDSPDSKMADAKLAAKYDDIPADDLNGDNPAEFKPEEVSVMNAINEYLVQTGKTAYKKQFTDIIIGILRDFDNAEKIEQISRFVGTVTNTSANLREPEEYESPEDEFDMGDEGISLEGGADQTGEENSAFSQEELDAAETTEPTPDEEMSAVKPKDKPRDQPQRTPQRPRL